MIRVSIMRWRFHAGAIAGDGATCGLIVPCHLSQLIGGDGTASGGDKPPQLAASLISRPPELLRPTEAIAT